MKIEFRDLKSQYKKYKSLIDDSVTSVMTESNFILGEPVKLLEQELAEYVGVKHVISCANGTDAMTLVLMAWNIKEGDAVFVPNYTFFATGEVVSYQGATPVFVDVEQSTFNMDASNLRIQILHTINEGILKPKAIIPVDLFGLPSNYYEITAIAKEFGLLVIEDAAQGFGGEFCEKRACSFGDAATTSFYPAKPLGCYGDGGAIFTNSDELAETLRSLRSHGVGTHRYDNVRIGLNSRLDTIQAAVLRIKLKALKDHELEDVNRVARQYDQLLSGIVITPKIPDGFFSSYAQYTIQTTTRTERDNLIEYLKTHNVPTMVYYPRTLHQQKAFTSIQVDEDLLMNSIHLTNVSVSIPIHPYLNDKEILYVTDKIKEFYSK